MVVDSANFEWNIALQGGKYIPCKIVPGTTVFFVGPNGSGKTRLASSLEVGLGERAHRISAHRSFRLNPAVPKINERSALSSLRFGDPTGGMAFRYRSTGRWKEKGETILLDDFDALLQALFAQQSNVALRTHTSVHAGEMYDLELTHFQHLERIWRILLPHRALAITGDDINVNGSVWGAYSASQMSDGERAVFYLLGQVLVAERDFVLIFDEPELHIHRSILSRLWDEVEAVRPDCAFVVITHDLEFVASRTGQKYVLRSYYPSGEWDAEEVPAEAGFSEEVATLILGSRRPILFVEGSDASLDLALYRACYPEWMVLPRGGCESVIHGVSTMRHNASLTRITCAGLVDADDYDAEDVDRLQRIGVSVLPVSEIENLFILPEVAAIILKEERFGREEIEGKLTNLYEEIFKKYAQSGLVEDAVVRYCRRRIDRILGGMDFGSAATAEDIRNIYAERTAALDIGAIAESARERIERAIAERDVPTFLANVDDKSLIATAAKHLKGMQKVPFESWIIRCMLDPKGSMLKSVVSNILPKIEAQ